MAFLTTVINYSPPLGCDSMNTMSISVFLHCSLRTELAVNWYSLNEWMSKSFSSKLSKVNCLLPESLMATTGTFHDEIHNEK